MLATPTAERHHCAIVNALFHIVSILQENPIINLPPHRYKDVDKNDEV
jgi:hypothetical protein